MSTPEDTVGDLSSAQVRAASKAIEGLAAFARKLASIDMKLKTIGPIEIDGLMYTNTKLPASVGLEIWPRLTVLLGSAFTRSIATGSLDGITPDVFVRVATVAMRDGLAPLCRDLLSRAQVDKLGGLAMPGNVVDDFDEHFAGEYLHLAKVCALVLAHNLRGPTRGGG